MDLVNPASQHGLMGGQNALSGGNLVINGYPPEQAAGNGQTEI